MGVRKQIIFIKVISECLKFTVTRELSGIYHYIAISEFHFYSKHRDESDSYA